MATSSVSAIRVSDSHSAALVGFPEPRFWTLVSVGAPHVAVVKNEGPIHVSEPPGDQRESRGGRVYRWPEW
jgi:hypothetical protein